MNKVIKDQYEFVLNGGDINEIPQQPLFDLLKSLYKDAARIWGNKVRLSINQEVVKKRLGTIGYNEMLIKLIEDYFRVYLFQDVTQITDTTREELYKILTDGFNSGLSLSEISDKIELLGIVKRRANAIARTEVNTAANRGSLIAAQATGLKLKKEWLATMDKRTRDTHRNVDGQTVNMDMLFQVGNDQMECPGDRGGKAGRQKTSAKEVVNCRCTCLYIPVEN